MVIDLIHIGQWPDEVSPQMAFLVEGLEPAPGAHVAVLHDGRFVRCVGVRVDPDFDFDDARAVVEAVGYVCGLLADVADLADDGDLFPMHDSG